MEMVYGTIRGGYVTNPPAAFLERTSEIIAVYEISLPPQPRDLPLRSGRIVDASGECSLYAFPGAMLHEIPKRERLVSGQLNIWYRSPVAGPLGQGLNDAYDRAYRLVPEESDLRWWMDALIAPRGDARIVHAAALVWRLAAALRADEMLFGFDGEAEWLLLLSPGQVPVRWPLAGKSCAGDRQEGG